MYGVTKEQEYRYMKHIYDTNGNPRLSVAKECNLVGYHEELCMRRIPKEKMVEIALKYLVSCNIKSAIKTQDHCGTWYTDLGYYNGNRWAIAIAWMDWENTNNWQLYGKVAYQPSNSIMQCDYDIDWMMPMADDGEIDDTEIYVGSVNDADDLLKTWNRIKREYIDEKEERIYV